ncbi:hypothetical protein ACFLRA_01245 [Bdellovibrionota bacterium]
MKRILLVCLVVLWATPVLATQYDAFLGNWVGAGNGTWGQMDGYKYIFKEGDIVASQMTITNGSAGYSSMLTCYSDSECSYSDSWNRERIYTVSAGVNGDLTFFWADGDDHETIHWFFSANGSFMEHFVGFVGGAGSAYVMGYSR